MTKNILNGKFAYICYKCWVPNVHNAKENSRKIPSAKCEDSAINQCTPNRVVC